MARGEVERMQGRLRLRGQRKAESKRFGGVFSWGGKDEKGKKGSWNWVQYKTMYDLI
jgi:hypothetical protein